MIKTVIKRDGSRQVYDFQKIFQSILSAARDVGGSDQKLALELAQIVQEKLVKTFKSTTLTTTKLGDTVEQVLINKGHVKTAKAYILYREKERQQSQSKESLGITDDIGLSYNSLYILKRRYLKRNEDGKIIETPKGMIKRVAKAISRAEKTKVQQEKWEKEFTKLLSHFDFLPGTRALTNAGKKRQQMGNCFVFPIQDSIDDIFQILYESSITKRNGGGCGFDFSPIRPKSSVVDGVPEIAAGPVKIMEMFDMTTRIFRQEGRYESGNMGILNVSHPDVLDFITSKEKDGRLSRTNISLSIPDAFIQAVKENKNWQLIDPSTGKVVESLQARAIWDLTCNRAVETGDPGLYFIDKTNQNTALANPLTKGLGPIRATNPCGEEPLYPYESCNLGYFTLPNYLELDKKGNEVFNFDRLAQTTKVATRLMDDMIDISWFPVQKVRDNVSNNRRIGMGVVGFAEILARMKIPFDDPVAFNLGEQIAKTIYETAFETSLQLGDEKGPFPNIVHSIWSKNKRKPRNVALITIPPSSGHAMICDTSYAIEPFFALVFYRYVLEGIRLPEVNKTLISVLKKEKLYQDKIIDEIAQNEGSIQSITKIPKTIRDHFKTALDLDYKAHIQIQAAFQKWTDNAVSKTINLPSSANSKDVSQAYMLAWDLNCKGITVYRDKSKQSQVMNFGNGEKK